MSLFKYFTFIRLKRAGLININNKTLGQVFLLTSTDNLDKMLLKITVLCMVSVTVSLAFIPTCVSFKHHISIVSLTSFCHNRLAEHNMCVCNNWGVQWENIIGLCTRSQCDWLNCGLVYRNTNSVNLHIFLRQSLNCRENKGVPFT